MMNEKCTTITGLLLAIAGAVWLAISTGMLAMTWGWLSGAGLLLAGLSFLAHGMCMCDGCCTTAAKKK